MPQSLVTVVESPERAAALLDPVRLGILEGLREPGSAAGVARRLGVPRQRVAYHVKELERHGLLRHVEDRRKGNCVERVMETAARQFVISPRALGALGADPREVRDRVSSSYLVAVAARTLDEVAGLRQAADAAGKRLATLTLDTVVRFPTPAAQRAFADELTQAVARLAARHGGAAEGEGRAFRVVAAVHPLPAPDTTTTSMETAS